MAAVYDAKFRIENAGGDWVAIACWGPDAAKLAESVASLLRVAGPRSSGKLASTVKVEGNAVLLGGPDAPYAKFQSKKLGAMAYAALHGQQVHQPARPAKKPVAPNRPPPKRRTGPSDKTGGAWWTHHEDRLDHVEEQLKMLLDYTPFGEPKR